MNDKLTIKVFQWDRPVGQPEEWCWEIWTDTTDEHGKQTSHWLEVEFGCESSEEAAWIAALARKEELKQEATPDAE